MSHIFCPFIALEKLNFCMFQFKLLQRRIATQNYLYKIGISLTDACTFCEQNTETVIHLFWECGFVQKFLTKLTILVDTASG